MTIRLSDDRVLTTAPERRRTVAAHLAGKSPMLAFAVADTHAHLLLSCDRTHAGQVARSVEISMSKRFRFGVAFEPARIRPVKDQSHLYRSYLYVLRQGSRHGLPPDPTHDACSVVDLLGLRRVAGSQIVERAKEHLPRLDTPAIAEEFGLNDLLGSGASGELDGYDGAQLAAATAAAVGAHTLTLRSSVTRDAIVAAVHLTRSFDSDQVAGWLGTTRRSVQRLRHLDRDPVIVRAVRMQWQLRSRPIEPPREASSE